MLPRLLEKAARQLDLAPAAGIAHLKGAAAAGRDTKALAHIDRTKASTSTTSTTQARLRRVCPRPRPRPPP